MIFIPSTFIFFLFFFLSEEKKKFAPKYKLPPSGEGLILKLANFSRRCIRIYTDLFIFLIKMLLYIKKVP
jgi:hypothetical protein